MSAPRAKRPGYVFWITGLSGSGKSTIGRMLAEDLRHEGWVVVYFDGDMLREVFGPGRGHTQEERLKLAMAYARLCRELALQGVNVVFATISMFHVARAWNRDNIENYREIFLRVALDELKKRDAKGLYAAYERGEVSNIVGLDVAAEEPRTPDLVIDNYGTNSPRDAVARIRGLVPRAAAPART